MSDLTAKRIFGISAIILLIISGIQIADFPGGMFFPGYYFGIIFILGILIACWIAAFIINLVFKKYSAASYLLLFFSLSLIYFNIHFYSPTLRITVPHNYTGEINLVLANIDENRLNIDKNGIGYINERTFDKTYRKPIVTDTDGNNLSGQLKGFNNLVFWTNPEHCCIQLNAIKSLNFEILPQDKSENPFKFFELTKHADRNITKLFPLKRKNKK